MIQIKLWSSEYATDEAGKKYIDLTSGGIFAAGFGPNDWEIKTAISGITHFCSYSPKYGNYNRDKYIELLKEITGFESVALFSAGTEATEAFWRTCRIYTNKPGVWGGLVDPDEVGADHPKCDQMHGMTLGAMIMAGKLTWRELGIFPELGVERFGTAPEGTACMIIEPYHAPSGQFHRMKPTIERIQNLQKSFPDIPLCIDEIQGGFGRTGRLWAHQHYTQEFKMTSPSKAIGYDLPILHPDFITIGKLAGGGLPLSALLGPKEIMESESVKKFGHLHSTHSGNPLMCAVGCAVIKKIAQEHLIEESARKGEMMHKELSTLPIRVHGKGLMAGLEFSSREECEKAVKMCEERGILVVDTDRKWIKIGPALTINEEVLMQGIKILKEIVEEIFHERNATPLGDSSQEPGGVGTDIPSSGFSSGQPGEVGSSEDGGPSGKPN